MANNVSVKDASGSTQAVKTTETASVHTPHHNVDAVVPGTGATNLGKAHDAAAAAGNTGVAVLARRTATPADIAGTEGDYEFLQTKDGRLWVSADVTGLVPGTGATSLGKAQDSVPGATDTGVAILAVRKDTPANVAGTDGDYERLQMSGGRLHTSGVEALTTPISEQVASSGAGSNVGFSSVALRSGVIVASAPSSNADKVFIHLASETGAVGVELVPGAMVVLPPVANANAWEAHFAGASDELYICGS